MKIKDKNIRSHSAIKTGSLRAVFLLNKPQINPKSLKFAKTKTADKVINGLTKRFLMVAEAGFEPTTFGL